MGKPILGKPLTTAEIANHFSKPETLEEMAWALRDWNEAATWLTEQGAPMTDENDIWLSTRERFEWYMTNVAPEGKR